MLTRRMKPGFLPTCGAMIWLAAAGLAAAAPGDPKRAGDVMGRDLDYLAFKGLGHLGVFGGRLVLECLNEKEPLQKNSVKSFKSKADYWGARYIPEKLDFRKVIATGWAQRNYQPSFTLSPVYQRGRHVNKKVWNSATKTWETRTVLVPAKFRCDTFVYFSYKAGIGRRLAGDEIMPAIVFGNCPKAR